jgi:hypothetical protein
MWHQKATPTVLDSGFTPLGSIFWAVYINTTHIATEITGTRASNRQSQLFKKYSLCFVALDVMVDSWA